jgi:hypothetical protein
LGVFAARTLVYPFGELRNHASDRWGDAPHSSENAGVSDPRFAYVFPDASFGEIEYVFEE